MPLRMTVKIASVALCIAVVAVAICAALWSGFSPGLFAFWVYLALALTLAAVSIAQAPLRSAAAVCLVGPLLGLFIWAHANIARIIAAAEELAAARPYCLQVPAGERAYRAIAVQSELNGLTMQAPSGEPFFRHWAFHAVLVIGNGDGQVELYNWSYRLRSFQLIKASTRERLLNPPLDPHCVPGPHFAKALPAYRWGGA